MKKPSFFSYFNNWISLCGAVIMIGSAFSFIFLFAIEIFTGASNAYLGILTFLAAPGFFFLGSGLAFFGWLYYRRQVSKQKEDGTVIRFSFDLTNRSDRRKFLLFTSGTFVFLIVSAIGSYETYHLTESVEFCGEVCHTVMEPEYTTYQAGAHARVACVECHIGSGAEWYVKSKLSGLYQVYSVAFNKYATPIDTPVHNLRPAQETCEQCHWPQKFTGDIDRTYPGFLADEANTPFTVRMSLKVGGANPRRGEAEGIHWHVSQNHEIEFIAEDEDLQVIPWIRVTYDDGRVEEYVTDEFEGNPEDYEIHKMDCMDCHNRPAHVFESPSDSVNQSLHLGHLSRELPGIKALAVELLIGEYEDSEEAFEAIRAGLIEAYPGHSDLEATVGEIQSIYSLNFFPKMKADWSAYPNNIGHMDWPGCFRCHDDWHSTPDGSKSIQMSNCNECHSILAQGSTPSELSVLHPDGVEFKHPGGDVEGFLCSDCHDGTLAE